MASLTSIVDALDALLATRETPDYPGALNGLQLANRGEVRRIGAAVDFSTRTVAAAIRARCDLLIVHHGMFWGGAQPLVARRYEQLRALLENDVAVYASHLPLDRHPEVGNNALLARELALDPTGEFGRYKSIAIGVRGESNLLTRELLRRVERFAAAHAGTVRTAGLAEGRPDAGERRTRRWAICTGAGASTETLLEARELGVDTLIVGEGPHHTFVDANDDDELVVVYAGHYATETLGVRAIAERMAAEFDVGSAFLDVPTGS